MSNSPTKEWTRYYRFGPSIDALHARFVTHKYPRHAHEYFVIGLVESGAQSFWYRGARHETPAGSIFLVDPQEPHTGETATSTGYVYRTLYPRIEDLVRIATDVGVRARTPFFKKAVIQDRLLAKLLFEFHRRLAHPCAAIECEFYFLRAMARLLTAHADPRISERSSGWARPAIRRACDCLEANFATDISLSKLAEAVGLSPYYLARTFERETGLPPHTYLENVRVRKAQELLRRGESLAGVAFAAGYSDQSHLTHRFKRFLGITPGQYASR